MEVLEMVLASGSKPEILHSEKGSEITSADSVGKLRAEDIKIS